MEFIPLQARTDPEHGGRWTSLRGGGREWLWHRDEPRRGQVAPGDPFADAGGLEECVPTVRGVPDHGDAWTRVWAAESGDPDGEPESGAEYSVHCDEFTLSRELRAPDGVILADYRLTAKPGYRFVWAAHALLDLGENARLHLAEGVTARLFPEAAAYVRQPWPDGAPWIEGDWPKPAGLRLDGLGPDDGSAVGAVLYEPDAQVAEVTITDGEDCLRMAVAADDAPVSIALWRNLRGFPQDGPYRSVGVEPMLGRVLDIAEACDGDCAVVPGHGELNWRLTISAFRRTEGS
jgi:hypothetical protein